MGGKKVLDQPGAPQLVAPMGHAVPRVFKVRHLDLFAGRDCGSLVIAHLLNGGDLILDAPDQQDGTVQIGDLVHGGIFAHQVQFIRVLDIPEITRPAEHATVPETGVVFRLKFYIQHREFDDCGIKQTRIT